MGQTVGTPSSESMIGSTVDTIQYEFGKHAQALKEIRSISYEDFNKCLNELNDLSRKCLDSNGHVTVFAVKKGTDHNIFWKASIKIACVKCDPATNRILKYKLISFREFLKVFNNFQKHLDALSSCEEQQEARQIPNILTNIADLSPSDEPSPLECCICLDRKTDLVLPCEHIFCSPCIERWNKTHKKCPICQTEVDNVDDSWVLSEFPPSDEINEEILTEFNALTVDEEAATRTPTNFSVFTERMGKTFTAVRNIWRPDPIQSPSSEVQRSGFP